MVRFFLQLSAGAADCYQCENVQLLARTTFQQYHAWMPFLWFWKQQVLRFLYINTDIWLFSYLQPLKDTAIACRWDENEKSVRKMKECDNAGAEERNQDEQHRVIVGEGDIPQNGQCRGAVTADMPGLCGT